MNMPFPGMDPYLEHSLLWPGVHIQLMVTIANQLQPLIRPRYVASLEERVFIEGPPRQIIPDVLVKESGMTGGMVASTLATDAPVLLEVDQPEIREAFVEILDLYNNQKLVTLIEVVSPSNKTKGPGRRSFLKKQRAMLKRDCHLVEIDLLRRGKHVLSIPASSLTRIEPFDYLTCVNRWPDRNPFELYPRKLCDRLPRVRIPLVAPDADVSLDLQTVLETVYQNGGYMLRIRYDEPCDPPLEPADQQWANECWQAYRSAHPEMFPANRS